MSKLRFATVDLRHSIDTTRRYLPENYSAVQLDREIVILGRDVAGWTLDGYVIPRLASGLIFAEEVKTE